MSKLQKQNEKSHNGSGADSIEHALRLLDRVAKNNSNEIKKKVNGGYTNLKQAISSSEMDSISEMESYLTNMESKFDNLQIQAKNAAKDLSNSIDKTVHTSPWYFIGSAAILGTAVGAALAIKTSNSKVH